MDLQIKITTLALAVAFSFFSAGCSKEAENTSLKPVETPKTLELIKADLVTVKTGSLTQSKAFTGTIQAIHQSSVQAQVSATVLQVNADVGQYVQKGQILVRLNNQDNSARLSQAQANLASAKAQAELNRSVMQRKANLLQQGFISKLEYEQSQLEYRAQQENVKAMQANVDIAQKAAQDTVINSPISGYITKRQVDAGQTVALGQTLFEIVDSTQVELKANIAASEQHAVNIGKNVNFSIQGSTIQQQGTISRVSPVADQISRNLEFYVKPNTTHAQLSIGSFVEGSILESNPQTGQIIPLKSIQNLKDAPHVWAVREQKLMKIPVTILQTDQRQELALVDGLMANDQISLVKFNEQDINKTIRLQ